MGDVRRRVAIAAGFLISAVAVALVVRTIDVEQALVIIRTANPLPLLGVAGVVCLGIAMKALRWSILLAAPDREGIPARRLAPPLFIGYLGNAVLPARLGEAMRAVLVQRREGIGIAESVGVVLLERLIDVATLALVALVAANVIAAPVWAVQVLLVVTVVSGGGLVLLTAIGVRPVLRIADRLGLRGRPRLRAVATDFAKALGGSSRRRAIVVAVAVSLVAWLVDGMSFWLAGIALGVHIDYPAALVVSGFAVLGTAIPSAPGYVGTFELAAAAMATAIGVSGASALALAIVAHVMVLATVTVGGLVSLLSMSVGMSELRRRASQLSGR
ncbi:MAG: lysylphosphatidylglycerol synthase transmembrane domain-containing protein [Chloroflexota bacterium]